MASGATLTSAEDAPILAVDDDPAVRRLIRAGLTHFGYHVDVAENTSEARECLRTRPYSLVLSDYEMPDGSGMDLLAYVNRVHPNLPFIMLTGYDDAPLACTAISSGALDFLTKPFEMRQLARLIEQNRARLGRERERNAQLTNEVLEGTIRALVAAVDAKDPYTATHSERVARLARCLGETLSLAPERLRVLEFAALLHDVGKIAVPERVLLKPSRLTVEEWAIFKRHPERSAEIVAQVAPLAEVATIVRHHHERMDGTGYPDGLMGEAIPPMARLISIADAYEALTSDRAYRRALRPPQAREVIRGSLATQFDPLLGEVFLSIDALP